MLKNGVPLWGDCTSNALSYFVLVECAGDDDYETFVPSTNENSSPIYDHDSIDSKTSSPSKGCSEKIEFF